MTNDTVFDSADRIAAYDRIGGIAAAEQHLFDRWIRPGSNILDLGVGTGRTVSALASRANRYIGIDYSRPMVETTRERFPTIEIALGDAADLSRFDAATFDAVVFSYNGLDYLEPYARRAQALSEIRRVLRDDGVFIASTKNPRALLRRPKSRTPRGFASAAVRTMNALRSSGLSGPVRRGFGYRFDHDHSRRTFCATPTEFRKELEGVGFTVIELVGPDFPNEVGKWSTPWAYVAAVPWPSDLKITTEPLPPASSNLESSWDALVARAGTGPFQTLAWVRAWCECLATRASAAGLIARRSGEVVGVLPIARFTRRLHRRVGIPLNYVGLAGSGQGSADHLGPLASGLPVAAALLCSMAQIAPRSSLLLESLDESWAELACGATGGRIVRRSPCAINERDPDGSFRDAWSRKARKNARRRERMLAEAEIMPRWSSGLEFPAALRELRALHQGRWQARSQPGLFSDQREDFLLRFADLARADCRPWVLTLEQRGQAIAALLGIEFRKSFSVYKTGWNPDFAHIGPGMALGQEAMRWSEARGLVLFDYLRGSGTHKTELGCRPRYDVTVLVKRGPLGNLLLLRESGPLRPRVSALLQATRQRFTDKLT